MGATPRSELFWLGILNYINYHAFEKTVSEHRCNILLKSRGECNKGLVSLLSKRHPTLPPMGQGSHRNAVDYFKKILWLFKLGTSSASPGLHLLCCTPHQPMALPGQADVPPPWTGDSWNEAWQDRGMRTRTLCTGDTQLTEEAQGGFCSNLSFKRSHETS